MNARKLGLSSGIVLMFGGFYALWVWLLRQWGDDGGGVYAAAVPMAGLCTLFLAFASVVAVDMLDDWWEWLHRE